MKRLGLALVAGAALASPAIGAPFAVEEATIPEIARAFREHRLTCHALVQAYLDRISAYDKQGPKLNAVLTLNPRALTDADRHDADFKKRGAGGQLYCVPLVIFSAGRGARPS